MNLDRKLDAPLLAVTGDEARQFARAFRLPDDVLERCSTLFCLELVSYHYVHGINPHVIIEEVLALEGRDHRFRGTPAADGFRGAALRGLRKKHWFAAPFIPKNVLNALNSGALDSAIMSALDPANAPEGETHEEYASRLSAAVARLTVEGSMQSRQQRGRLTGEWIVFAPHEKGNHYLSVSTHREGDDIIREKIIRHCVPEFPFLRDVLRVGSAD